MRAARVQGARLRRARGGFVLLELILATILFSVAVIGLARAAQYATRDLAALNRENDVRICLRSFLEEVKHKSVDEMTVTTEDARLGVTFQSTLEELTMKNVDGTVLSDLYLLRVVAVSTDGSNPEESLEVWVYKPRSEQRR